MRWPIARAPVDSFTHTGNSAQAVPCSRVLGTPSMSVPAGPMQRLWFSGRPSSASASATGLSVSSVEALLTEGPPGTATLPGTGRALLNSTSASASSLETAASNVTLTKSHGHEVTPKGSRMRLGDCVVPIPRGLATMGSEVLKLAGKYSSEENRTGSHLLSIRPTSAGAARYSPPRDKDVGEKAGAVRRPVAVASGTMVNENVPSEGSSTSTIRSHTRCSPPGMRSAGGASAGTEGSGTAA
mmetsp:Transcript_15503/g.58754  ORF Transcript_15503/g.58754 Transcript_15503/m.58754 type:complete len:242 (-) Transcript_15503:2098-2823(-)